MIDRHVPRESTEAAIRLIRLTRAESDTITAHTPVGRIVRAGSAFGSDDLVDARKQAFYLRMVSIAETYTDVLMSELLGERVPSQVEIIGKLVASAELAASSSWQRRSEFFDNLHGIRLESFPRNNELGAAKRVRNIVAHGLGRITDKEIENSRLTAQLGLVEVRVQDRRVAISERSLAVLCGLLIDYVAWLDTESRV